MKPKVRILFCKKDLAFGFQRLFFIMQILINVVLPVACITAFLNHQYHLSYFSTLNMNHASIRKEH